MKRTVALLGILITAACSRTPSPEAGEVRVVPLGGDVSLLDAGETSLLDEATTIDSGIAVATGAEGRAEIQLPGGQRLELAPRTELQVENDFSEVAEGSVLVRTQSPLMIRAGGAEIEASDATFRVTREASVLLAMYSGQAAVLGSGVDSVPALRQATVLQGGEIAGGIVPLEVRPNDPWDVELLGAAIDLGTELLDLERGLSHQLPPGRESSAVSAALEKRDFPPRDVRAAISRLGDAARAVVAAVVAQEAARIDGITDSLRTILVDVVDLRALGASWIVVVAEWGLPAAATALTRELRALAAAIADLLTPPPAPLTNTSSVSGPGQTPPDPGPGGSGNPDPDPPDRNKDPQPPPPPPDDGPPGSQPAPPCANEVECAVDEILDDPGPAARAVS